MRSRSGHKQEDTGKRIKFIGGGIMEGPEWGKSRDLASPSSSAAVFLGYWFDSCNKETQNDSAFNKTEFISLSCKSIHSS